MFACNLACYYAARGPRDKLYEAVRHAWRLGNDQRKLREDTDFKSFLDDPEFLAALE